MEWWDAHYHRTRPRPPKRSREALESMYLDRLRYLHQEFSEIGIGEESPTLRPGQISTLLRHQYELVPILLGTRMELEDAWGYYPVLRPLADLAGLEPVDISEHPEGEWILAEKERLEGRYGECTHSIDIGSVTNNAFRMIGEELYLALLSDPSGIRALFETLLETQRHLHRFLARHFGGQDPVPISNCNVHRLGPSIYREIVRPFDARQNLYTQQLTNVPPRAAVHHCDVPADDFLQSLAGLPGIASLEASFTSDIPAVKAALPGARFNALVSPPAMLEPPEEFDAKLRRAIRDGADALQFWNIDPALTPARLRQIWRLVREECSRSSVECTFSAMPLCWEEMEWCHARYR